MRQDLTAAGEIEGVSVVICCYNSVQRLPDTLRHLSLQKVGASIPWEIIVIDNASTDDTAAVAKDYWARWAGTVPLRVAYETTPGKNFALVKGFELARYAYVIIVDDDNWLADTYVQTAYDVMSANPAIGALGGQGEAVCESPPPDWFGDFEPDYAVGKQAAASGSVKDTKGYIHGAASVFRKSVFIHLRTNGFRFASTCRKGDLLLSGGDNELCYAYRLAGYDIWYDERLYFRHYLPAGRLSWPYLKRLHEGFGLSQPLLMPYLLLLSGKKKAWYKYRWPWLLLMGTILYLRQLAQAGLGSQKHRRVRQIQLLRSFYQLKGIWINRKVMAQTFEEVRRGTWLSEEYKFLSA